MGAVSLVPPARDSGDSPPTALPGPARGPGCHRPSPSARVARRGRPAAVVVAWAGVVAAGAALGVLSRLGDDLSQGWAWIANIGGPWLVLAFALGASAGSRRVGAGRGAVGLLCAVGAYYGWIGAVEHGAGRHHLVAVAVLWAAAGLVAGIGFGAGGWWWRAGPAFGRLVGAGVLSAALVGEAAVLLEGESTGSQAVLLAELAVGGALPWVLLRHPGDVARSAAVAASALPAAMVATAAVLALGARLAS